MGDDRKVKSEISRIVSGIKRYSYTLFSCLATQEEIIIIETGKINNQFDVEHLIKIKVSLTKQLNFMKNVNLELYDFILEKLNMKKVNFWNVDKLSTYHFELSVELFKLISIIEQNIKNKIIWEASKKDKDGFVKVINILISDDSNHRFKYLRKRANSKLDDDNLSDTLINHLLLSEFGIIDLVEFFNLLRDPKYIKSFKILEFLEDLFGKKKFEEIYHSNIDGDFVASNGNIDIIQWFIDELYSLNKIRNKIMHGRTIFSDERGTHKIERGLLAIKNLNFENHDYEESSIQNVIKLTNKLTSDINDQNVTKYFERRVIDILK